MQEHVSCFGPDGECETTETRTVEERLAAIEETQQKILELIQTANLVIETVVKEVKPTMEMLMSHPMLKMLGVGGKKK